MKGEQRWHRYVGLDVSLKQTAICVVDGDCGVVWQGCADTPPEMILSALGRWVGKIARLGLETGSITPWLARALKARIAVARKLACLLLRLRKDNTPF